MRSKIQGPAGVRYVMRQKQRRADLTLLWQACVLAVVAYAFALALGVMHK